MNPRITIAASPAERIAAVARSLVARMARCPICEDPQSIPKAPDYADFRDEIEPFLQFELLKARLEEANAAGNRERAIRLLCDLVLLVRNIEKKK